jgi:hypothetical protein
MRRTALVLVLTASTAAVAVAATLSPFFLGAPAGIDVPFETVALPVPEPMPPGIDLADVPFFEAATVRSPFTPSLHRLLEGESLITSERQMREVWRRLFSVPYDASQFDFSTTFVVFMGGGAIANGSFDISAVELVEASYASPGGQDGDPSTETFLSVTATTFQSGVHPEDPPAATWHVSAVKVSRALLDDVVFRRNVVLGV